MDKPNFDFAIEKHEKWISGLISDFDWSEGRLSKKDKYETCSENKGHRMPANCMKKHAKYCHLRNRGYQDSEIDELKLQESNFSDIPSQKFPKDYSEITRIIKERQPDLDVTVQNVKQFTNPPGNEIGTALSQSTQLALYDYFMSLTEKKETPILEFNQNDGSEKKREKSELEIRAELRDAKRRRQSYKGKSTHTGSKSYNEIIREVIANQMETIQQEWKESLPTYKPKSSRSTPDRKRKRLKFNDPYRDYHSKRRR